MNNFLKILRTKEFQYENRWKYRIIFQKKRKTKFVKIRRKNHLFICQQRLTPLFSKNPHLLLAQFLQGLQPRSQLIVSRGEMPRFLSLVACHFSFFFFFSTRINLTLAPLHPSPPPDRASSEAGEPPFISGPPTPLSVPRFLCLST